MKTFRQASAVITSNNANIEGQDNKGSKDEVQKSVLVRILPLRWIYNYNDSKRKN